jgi:amino acid adenylation domain-containing protein
MGPTMRDSRGTLHACLPTLLRAQAGERPDDTAVVVGDDRLSFAELVAHSERLAVRLRQTGVTPEDCVGLFVAPSLELVVGVWGILFSGGAYLPLSPEYPDERVRYMIENSRTKLIFTQESLKSKLAALAPPDTVIVTLDDVADVASSAVADCPRPDHLAYVIYTSGSTGKPKGVMIEHGSIVNQMRWLHTDQELNHDRVVLQKTPMSFDAAQWEILAPACGSTVVVGSPGIYRDPDQLVDTIRRHGVTTLQCVPTLLQALVDTEGFAECTSLTQIYSGGEALTKKLVLEFLALMPSCELINLYGPTECTINSSSYRVDPETVAEGPNPISIGAPVHNTAYYILDKDGKPVNVGEIGELHVGGVQVARGYLHRPDLTAERFVRNPFAEGTGYDTLFRTGDLAYFDHEGNAQFVSRADNQIKLRGFRVELDEIKLGIEDHEWVKQAAVIVKNDPRTGFQNLIACVELNPRNAALMDQGHHGAHHQSKESRLQVRAQLSNPGRRTPEDLAGRLTVDLPGKAPTDFQRRWVFARKTYRFFEGGPVTKDDLLSLLTRPIAGTGPRGLDELSYDAFGEILRSFGDCISDERLLPKYAYASPGSLYAAQLYVELDGIGGLPPGYYYYHPGTHQLVLITEKEAGTGPRFDLHFVGKRAAIEPVYKVNIREVLEIEAGHMIGLFEQVLPPHGLNVTDRAHDPATLGHLDCADDDYYLGSFGVVPEGTDPLGDQVDVYVQAFPGKVEGLPAGQYRYHGQDLEKISDDAVLKKDVIAINQHVYERASFGMTVVSRTEKTWRDYIDLGRKLQYLAMNELRLGFMPSGYSSRGGADLPAARRMRDILEANALATGASYFFVGGRVTEDQVRHRGMKEDSVHMKGPAEMIRDDLITFLPDYMIPNKVVVLDALPLTANGKVDTNALKESDRTALDAGDRPFVAPSTSSERTITEIWQTVMKRDTVSIHDDFFESGGNSLVAVRLVNALNREFGTTLPLQVVFEAPTIEKLGRRVDGIVQSPLSRLLPLQPEGSRRAVYCWPGLGGYPMNLRLLANQVDIDRPLYGIQAYGINDGEVPYSTITEMAARDVAMIREKQPEGPYTLWGYSFGARVAFESAYLLERDGEQVDNLFLIAPGSPKVRAEGENTGAPGYENEAYVKILFSVFAASITDPLLADCLAETRDEETFIAFICRHFPDLGRELVERIVAIVGETFEFKYTFSELARRRLSAPITVFKATGDDYSFLESSTGYATVTPVVVDLEADHYGLLKDPGVAELIDAITTRLSSDAESVSDRAA